MRLSPPQRGHQQGGGRPQRHCGRRLWSPTPARLLHVVTDSAARAAAVTRVSSRRSLRGLGFDAGAVRRQVEARRWRLAGAAVVPHLGPLTRADRIRIALINAGPRSALTSFTALELAGLKGWSREPVHVLVPMGTKPRLIEGVPVRVHRVGTWRPDQVRGRIHEPAFAALVAASSLPDARSACGVLAATVQQRLVTAADLRTAIGERARIRHRAVLAASIEDIAMGAQALSEIDFVALCRRHGLPLPTLQALRREPDGRRRFLDAGWDLPDGRRVAVEVDGTLVLRFSSLAVRTQEALVVSQLRRALGLSAR